MSCCSPAASSQPPPPPPLPASTMVNRIKLANIPALCRANCRIKHPERVETLINDMAVAGTDKLQLISDFDFTISKQRLADGTAMHSSFFIFERCQSIPQAVRDRNQALCRKYRPIEVDGRITIADKLKVCVWGRHIFAKISNCD